MAHAARLSTPASPGHVPAMSGGLRHPVAVTLGVGTLATLILIALAAVDAGGRAWLWDNAHWTVAPITAVTAGLVAARRSTGLEHRVRLAMTGALSVWLIGQLAWVAQAVRGDVAIPSIADGFFLASCLPVGALLVITARRFLSGARQAAVYLDALAVALAIVAVVVAFHPAVGGPTALAGTSVFGLVYAICFLSTAGAAVIGAVATRAEVAPRGIYLIILGTFVVGVAYSSSLLDVASGSGKSQTLPGYVLSLGLLVIGTGIATWTGRRETRPRRLRIADGVHQVVPLAAAVVAAGTLLVPGVPEEPHEIVLKLCALATAALLVARQTLLLRERGAVLAEVQGAHALTAEALERNRHLASELREQIVRMESVQQQLIHATRQSAVGQLASAIAHEVNNPLTGVLGYADLLLDELPPDGRGREELETIRSEALRARHILRTLVEFARPSDQERSPTDIDDLVRRTVDVVRAPTTRAGIRIVESYAGRNVVPADGPAIGQVVVNLMTNATQAIADGGTIRVATRADAGGVVITIADDGRGMDDATLARIFEPFFTTLPLDRGHGLGLPVSQGIVEGHGGRIEVASRPGRGTTVEVHLPAVDGPAGARP